MLFGAIKGKRSVALQIEGEYILQVGHTLHVKMSLN